jgi:hypothetical protein
VKIGNRVRYTDAFLGDDPSEPMPGVVVEPTGNELNEARKYGEYGPDCGDVMVEWADGKRYWEDAADLVVIGS